MKTIINKSGFAWCILLALAFTGCQGDQEGKHHFDNKVFISAASYTPEVRVMRDALDVTEEQTCEITVAMAQPVAQDITVSFADSLIDTEQAARLKTMLEHMLNELSPMQKSAIYMRYMYEMEYAEIAEILDVTPHAVRKFVSKGLGKLRSNKDRLLLLALFSALTA